MLQRLRLPSARGMRLSGTLMQLAQNWLNAETSRPIVIFQTGSIILVRFGVKSAAALFFGLCSFIVVFRSMGVTHEALSVLLLVSPASLILFSFLQGLLFSPRRFARPEESGNIVFGFFGGLFGMLLTFVFASFYYKMNLLLLLDASALLGGFIHAYARTACLNYGCCHGKELPAHAEQLHTVYRNPLSKAVRVSKLRDRPLYPVQVYESAGCLIIGLVILALANTVHRAGLLAGTYLLLYGALRFGCEFLRGEKDTLFIGRYSIYQWVSMVMMIGGFLLMVSAAGNAPAAISVNFGEIAGFLLEFTPQLIFMPAVILFFYGFHFKKVGKWR